MGTFSEMIATANNAERAAPSSLGKSSADEAGHEFRKKKWASMSDEERAEIKRRYAIRNGTYMDEETKSANRLAAAKFLETEAMWSRLTHQPRERMDEQRRHAEKMKNGGVS
jgi:hypothetical protein